MKTHLPTRLRAALLAAIFACAAQTATAVTYTEDTTVSGDITENIIVKDNVTVNVGDESGRVFVTGTSLQLGNNSNVNINGVSIGDYEKPGTFTVSGPGTITNEEFIDTSDKLVVKGSTLINNAYVDLYADGSLENATVTNNGTISINQNLTATNSTIDNANGNLDIFGSADVINSKLENAGNINIFVSDESRVGKAILTIDAATVEKSGFNALPKKGIKVEVDAMDSLHGLVGNSYYFVNVAGYGYYGTADISFGSYPGADSEYALEAGSTNVYRHTNGAYYFTMDKIMSGSSVIGLTFGKDAAFINYDYGNDGNNAYGNIVYTTEETLYGDLHIGTGASITMNEGAALTIEDGNLKITGKGSLSTNGGVVTLNNGDITISGNGVYTIDGGRLTLSEGNITTNGNGVVQMKINGKTTADEAIISGLDSSATQKPNIDVLIDSAAAGTLAGNTYQLGEHTGITTSDISSTAGALTWVDGTSSIGNGSFTSEITYANGTLTFGTMSAEGTVSGDVSTGDEATESPSSGMVIITDKVENTTPGSSISAGLVQDVVVSEGSSSSDKIDAATAKDTAIEGADSVISTDYNDNQGGKKHTNVVYGKDVKGNSGKVKTSSLSSTVTVTETDSAGATTTTPIAQSTDSLVVEFTEKTELENGTLGFDEEDKGKQVTIDNEVQIITTIDIVKNSGSEVTLTNMEVKAERALEMDGGTLELKGTQMTVGGHKLTDEEHKQLHIGDTTLKVETDVTAESLLDLHTNTKVNGGKLVLDGTGDGTTGTDTSFQVGYMKDAAGKLDKTADTSVEFHGTEIDLRDSQRGHDDKHYVAFGGDKAGHQTIHLHDAHLHGTGHVKNVHMHGGKFGIGNSPGVMSITDADFSGTTWTFHLIDGARWNTAGANTTPGGSFSQLKLDGANTASGITITLNYQTETTGGYTDIAQSDFGTRFEEGASITLIDTSAGSITGNYTFKADTLPELAEAGLMWDTSRLFSTGAIYVIAEMTAAPGRIANTMAAAAGTTGTFGRLGMQQLDAPRLNGTNVWAQAFADCQDRNTTDGRTGFDSNATGFALGVDKQFKKMPVILGAAIGTSNGTIKPNRGSATYTAGKIDQDGTQLGVYGRYTVGSPNTENNITIDGYISYGAYENDSYRSSYATGKAATASWDEDAWAMGLTVTRNYKLREHTFISPYVGVEYTTADMDSVTERSQSSVRYSADDSYRNLALILGVSAHREYGLRNGQKLTPYASIALSQDIMRQDAKVTATSAAGTTTDESAHQGRTALQFSVGATWQISNHWSMNAGYSIETREDAVDQNAGIGATYAF